MSFVTRAMSFLADFFLSVVRSRKILWELTRQDLRQRYLGSVLGILWAFIQPLITILVFWFIFSVGFKSQPVKDVPFILWFISGIIPWFFISDALQNGTGAVLAKPYLVKKIVFQVRLLPVIQLMSSMAIHLFFIGILIVFFLLYGHYPSIHWLQIPYFTIGAIFLLLGLTWFTSAVTVFFRDFGQLVAVVVQLGFWVTPVMWSFDIMPEKFWPYLKLNPVFYITEGYRNAMLGSSWFWQFPEWTIYFWVFSGITFFSGAFVFARLRRHFADVL